MSTLRRAGMTKAGFRLLRRPMIHMTSSQIQNTWEGRRGGVRGEGQTNMMRHISTNIEVHIHVQMYMNLHNTTHAQAHAHTHTRTQMHICKCIVL